jgi:hypothetical protein
MTATLSTIAREIEYDFYLRNDRASSLMPSDRGLWFAADRISWRWLAAQPK